MYQKEPWKQWKVEAHHIPQEKKSTNHFSLGNTVVGFSNSSGLQKQKMYFFTYITCHLQVVCSPDWHFLCIFFIPGSRPKQQPLPGHATLRAKNTREQEIMEMTIILKACVWIWHTSHPLHFNGKTSNKANQTSEGPRTIIFHREVVQVTWLRMWVYIPLSGKVENNWQKKYKIAYWSRSCSLKCQDHLVSQESPPSL